MSFVRPLEVERENCTREGRVHVTNCYIYLTSFIRHSAALQSCQCNIPTNNTLYLNK